MVNKHQAYMSKNLQKAIESEFAERDDSGGPGYFAEWSLFEGIDNVRKLLSQIEVPYCGAYVNGPEWSFLGPETKQDQLNVKQYDLFLEELKTGRFQGQGKEKEDYIIKAIFSNLGKPGYLSRERRGHQFLSITTQLRKGRNARLEFKVADNGTYNAQIQVPLPIEFKNLIGPERISWN